MSTRSSIWYARPASWLELHVFNEMMDGYTYLEIRAGRRSCTFKLKASRY